MNAGIENEMIHAAEVLNSMGCLPATDGNFSARSGSDKAIVTRQGIEKRYLCQNDLLEIDISEMCPFGASSEWKLHRAIYESRPEVNAILHVHAPYLGTFVAAGKIPDVSLLMETEMTLGGIALVPYVEPGTQELGEAALKHGGKAAVLILERHGVVSTGNSIREALHRLERAEFLARVQLAMKLL